MSTPDYSVPPPLVGGYYSGYLDSDSADFADMKEMMQRKR